MRKHLRTTTLAATALLAALSLTACNADDITDNGKKAGESAPAASEGNTAAPKTGQDTEGAAKGASEGSSEGAAKGSSEGNSSGTSNSSAGNASAKGGGNGGGSTSKTPVTCTGANTKVTVTQVSRPINHLLLTATNTGTAPCFAYYAPGLRFDNAQAAFPVLESSKPQAVVTLAPGQSGYAAIGLAGEPDGQEQHKSNHLTVYFTGRANQGSVGSPAELTLPAGTTWADNGFVTYWQADMADALTY
ncbi:DUF4232 domain-containing protein [Streptomyces sp. NPDC092952]|uniref:DUF4232 domain-containing protein n=1 Tax=Streptomyces sp. NPDC092952 TaxID=3366018 RepID=UPI00380945E4